MPDSLHPSAKNVHGSKPLPADTAPWAAELFELRRAEALARLAFDALVTACWDGDEPAIAHWRQQLRADVARLRRAAFRAAA